MEESDIKKFQDAKRGLVGLKLSSFVLLLVSVFLPFSHSLGISQHLIYFVPGLAVFVFVGIWGGYKGVSNQDLLNIIERQIARDPKAIQRLSKRDT